MKRERWFSALLTVVIVLGAAGLALMPAQARGDRDDPPPEVPVPYSLAITPATAEGFVGDVHTVVARVKDRDRNPMEGVEVSFVVTGAHRVTGRAVTNWRGEAPFSYRGTLPGTDTAVAFAPGGLTFRATMRWLVRAPTQGFDITFVNTTNQSVNDIHFETVQGTTVLDSGPFGDITGSGTTKVTLSNPLNEAGDPAPIPPGGSVVLRFGTAGGLSYKWWWTMDGRPVTEKQSGTGGEPGLILPRDLGLVGFQTSVRRKFGNTTNQSVNDMHFQFGQGTYVLDPGPFRYAPGSGTSTVRLSNPVAPIGPEGSVVLRFGARGGSIRYKYWYWTLDGDQVGPKQGPGTYRDM